MTNTLLTIDWSSLWFGKEAPEFLIDIILRTVMMFIVLLISLRALGKRSVAQLSVFEIGVIIGLGTAAGDPMIHKDVGLIPGLLVFVIIIGLYRLLTYFINYNERVETVLEGKPSYVIENGRLNFKNLEKETLAREELFMELRRQKITHLGQLQYGILETNGMVSAFLFPEDKVQWGLPILPHLSENKLIRVNKKGMYACAYCGTVEELPGDSHEMTCNACHNKKWIAAIREQRVE